VIPLRDLKVRILRPGSFQEQAPFPFSGRHDAVPVCLSLAGALRKERLVRSPRLKVGLARCRKTEPRSGTWGTRWKHSAPPLPNLRYPARPKPEGPVVCRPRRRPFPKSSRKRQGLVTGWTCVRSTLRPKSKSLPDQSWVLTEANSRPKPDPDRSREGSHKSRSPNVIPVGSNWSDRLPFGSAPESAVLSRDAPVLNQHVGISFHSSPEFRPKS